MSNFDALHLIQMLCCVTRARRHDLLSFGTKWDSGISLNRYDLSRLIASKRFFSMLNKLKFIPRFDICDFNYKWHWIIQSKFKWLIHITTATMEQWKNTIFLWDLIHCYLWQQKIGMNSCSNIWSHMSTTICNPVLTLIWAIIAVTCYHIWTMKQVCCQM